MVTTYSTYAAGPKYTLREKLAMLAEYQFSGRFDAVACEKCESLNPLFPMLNDSDKPALVCVDCGEDSKIAEYKLSKFCDEVDEYASSS